MTGLAKHSLNHFTDTGERLEPSPGEDTMDRALVLFALAVALGMPGDTLAQIRQRVSRLAAEPVIALDRKAFRIEFKPKDTSARLALAVWC